MNSASGVPPRLLALLARALCVAVVLGVLVAPKAVLSAVLAAYTPFVDSVYPCEEAESINGMVAFIQTTKYDIRKQNVLQRVTGNVSVTMKGGISNALWARARLDSRQHAHWADTYSFNFPDKACDHGRMHMPGVWSVILKQDISAGAECGVPPAVYTFDNEAINWTFPKFPILPLGAWTFHVTLGEGRTTYFCQNIAIRTVGKREH